jgi:hypothetical protein
MDTYAPARRAARPSASVAGDGTVTAWSCSRANQAEPGPHGVDRQTQSG